MLLCSFLREIKNSYVKGKGYDIFLNFIIWNWYVVYYESNLYIFLLLYKWFIFLFFIVIK